MTSSAGIEPAVPFGIQSAAAGAYGAGEAGIDPFLPQLTRLDFESLTGLPRGTQKRPAFAPPGGAGNFSWAPVQAGGGLRGNIVSSAKSMLGVPYVWGGSSPSGVDCSGFIQLVFKRFGISLPRVSYQQARYGPTIGLGQLRPGDLVAWDNSSRNNGADHIAIYIGGGMIIEAPRPGMNVRIRKLGKSEKAWGVRMSLDD